MCHMISVVMVAMDEHKVQGWLVPCAMCSFLGLAGYYRQFI
jgi:hypothetical protein